MKRTVFALVLVMVFGASALAAAPLTPHDVARLRAVSAAAVSPDGARVAYLLSVPRQPLVDDDGPAWSELHVIGPAGVSRPFITGKVAIGAIRWSGDGREIFYLARRGDDTARALYAIPVGGGESRRGAVF